MFERFTEKAIKVIMLAQEEARRLGHNFVGTELDPKLSYAKIAHACGFKGVKVNTQEELTEALKLSCKEQMEGTTTFIEVMLNQELGEPFRRDAMKKPVKVAGIEKSDMKPQKSLAS